MVVNLTKAAHDYDRQKEELVTAKFAVSHGLPYVNLVNYPFVGDVLGLIPLEVATKFQTVAFMRLGSTVRVASVNPFGDGLAEEMSRLGEQLGLTFQPFIASQSSVKYALSRYHILVTPKKAALAMERQVQTALGEIKTLRALQQKIASVSTSELFEALITGAVNLEASDIHIEPMTKGVIVRFRLDGTLVKAVEIPEKSYKALLARIKTSARIKIDKTAVAQDGRMTISVNGEAVDIRVNSLPGSYGEILVLRLLLKKRFFHLDELGLPPEIVAATRQAISKTQGIIFLAGATGSGKTTTLYSVIKELNTPERKIITIEDPIEYKIDGIDQVQLSTDSGFDFPQALRAILRQDPDVIMVGEIRDKETAEIALEASQTGHLVLATIHATSATGVIPRLTQMGVNPSNITGSINLIIAQRLERNICTNCNGQGCDLCHQTGYKGRSLVAEMLVP